MRETFSVTVSVTAKDAPAGYGNESLADGIRDGVFTTIHNMSGLDPVVMEVQPAPERVKVWVATVSDENDSPGPAVYVSPSPEGVVKVLRAQQGVPEELDGDGMLEWLDSHGKTAVWDSYYVETGDE